MNIAVIPARGGSKRIPRKNIKEFCGKPMIAYAITAAQGSGLFQHVVVSTDDEEIASISREYGAEIPFTRPADLANDYATTVPVIAHAVAECRAQGMDPEYVCCIYPGVPLIETKDIASALALLVAGNGDYAFPVTSYPAAIQRALRRDSTGRMAPFDSKYELVRTQDLDPAYHDAGQFYWGRADAWLTNLRIHSGGLGHLIPSWRVVDIDTLEDWQRAEMLFQALRKETGSRK